MSSPQLEHGYTRIANEILEALAVTNLNGTQRRILDVIFRQTYGYQRKEKDLSVTFIANATNIHKKQIQRELNALIERKIVTVVEEATFNKSRVIAFNKNYHEWLGSGEVTKKLPPNKIDVHTGNKLAPSTGSELATQKKKIKENIKENRINSFPDNAYTERPEDLFEMLWQLYPNKKGKSSVSKKSKKAIHEIGYDRMVKAIERYKKDLAENPWKQAMYSSTFFNGRYKDYLPVEEDTTQTKPIGKTKVMTEEDIEKSIQKLENEKIKQAKANRSKIRFIDL